jgi:tetratricopeptide (TPR) repeat protein
MARYALAFLDVYLKSSRQGADLLARAPADVGIPAREVTIMRRVGLRPRPTLDDFAYAATRLGLAAAPQVLGGIRERDPDYTLREDDVDVWGSQLMMSGRRPEALGILELNIAMYPRSSAAYFSLAEAYRYYGERGLATANYERAVALDSTNADARRELASLRSR